MSQPPLTKATITVLEGERKKQVITVLFNPTEYTFDRSNSYKATPVPGLGAPLLQFVNGESDHLSMDLFLDDYTDPRGPTSMQQKETDPLGKRLRDLTKLLEIDRTLHAPPPVRLEACVKPSHKTGARLPGTVPVRSSSSSEPSQALMSAGTWLVSLAGLLALIKSSV